jgi:hypothetical protein
LIKKKQTKKRINMHLLLKRYPDTIERTFTAKSTVLLIIILIILQKTEYKLDTLTML